MFHPRFALAPPLPEQGSESEACVCVCACLRAIVVQCERPRVSAASRRLGGQARPGRPLVSVSLLLFISVFLARFLPPDDAARRGRDAASGVSARARPNHPDNQMDLQICNTRFKLISRGISVFPTRELSLWEFNVLRLPDDAHTQFDGLRLQLTNFVNVRLHALALTSCQVQGVTCDPSGK